MTEDDTRKSGASSVVLAYVRGLTEYLAAHGIPLPPSGMSWTDKPRDTHIPMIEYAQALDQAAATSGDTDLGLHVGESIRLGHYGVLGYVALSCDTLGQALQHYRRYQALAADIGQRVEVDENRVRISWTPSDGVPHRHAAEANLAAWIGFARWITDRPLPLISVEFRHPTPASTQEHQRIFGHPPAFGRSRHALSFDALLLELPLPQADAEMRALMDRHASRRLSQLSAGTTLIERLQSFILQHLATGEVGLDAAAAALNLGARALQRKLAADGQRYRDLVDSVRRSQAAHYLDDPDVDLSELALLLGFSEQSAFQRAFRRWYDDTPNALRRRSGDDKEQIP